MLRQVRFSVDMLEMCNVSRGKACIFAMFICSNYVLKRSSVSTWKSTTLLDLDSRSCNRHSLCATAFKKRSLLKVLVSCIVYSYRLEWWRVSKRRYLKKVPLSIAVVWSLRVPALPRYRLDSGPEGLRPLRAGSRREGMGHHSRDAEIQSHSTEIYFTVHWFPYLIKTNKR